MKKFILIVLLLLVLAVGGLAVYIQMQPAQFHVERTATIDAPAEKVFPHVNNFKNWKKWSPWEKLDPEAEYTYEGPESGQGAICKWSGNDKVGEGKMTITQSTPNKLIKMKLDFVRPMEGTSDVEFILKEKDGKTEVTWTLDSENNFMGKAFGLFMNAEKMVGDSYEKGLASLKAIVEKE